MSIQTTLQKYMDDWKAISGLDFCLLTEANEIFVTTCSRKLPSETKLEEFRAGNALIMANAPAPASFPLKPGWRNFAPVMH